MIYQSIHSPLWFITKCLCLVWRRGHSPHAVTLPDDPSVPPMCLQAGWKENHATFMSELKNLQASGLTTLGHALRAAFDLLNLNRLVSGIDNYGQVCDVGNTPAKGRCVTSWDTPAEGWLPPSSGLCPPETIEGMNKLNNG